MGKIRIETDATGKVIGTAVLNCKRDFNAQKIVGKIVSDLTSAKQEVKNVEVKPPVVANVFEIDETDV